MKREKPLAGGYINRVVLDTETLTVRKYYQMGNGVNLSPQLRFEAERESLETYPFAPELINYDDQSIEMSFVVGESFLDSLYPKLDYNCQHQVAETAGKTLAAIHNEAQASVVPVFHTAHWQHCLELVEQTQLQLTSVDIDPESLSEYLYTSYDPDEIEARGLVWTHGDYWFNNLIGEIDNTGFRLGGVIDWELAQWHTPYRDFGSVLVSIEQPHPNSQVAFWRGYGYHPQRALQQHFASLKILEWIQADSEFNPQSPFYSQKINFIKNLG